MGGIMIAGVAGQDCTGLFCTPQWPSKPGSLPLLPCRLRHGLGPHHLAADVGDPPSQSPWGGLGPLCGRELADSLHPDPVLPPSRGGYCLGGCPLLSPSLHQLTAVFCPTLQNAFGLDVPFLFFAVISAGNILFTGCCVPETKGRSLEQIEAFFRTGRRSFLR